MYDFAATVLFANERFLAVDKPPAVLTVAGRQGALDPRACLVDVLSPSYGRLWPVHRLDYEVSGLVLLARDADAHRMANSWFESRGVKKAYEAWTLARPSGANEGVIIEWECLLLRGKRRAYESPIGKLSRTRAVWRGTRNWKDGDGWAHEVHAWQLEPLTGRSHQLRYEMSRHGAPILGDSLYGSERSFVPGAIALRAIRLDFSECVGAGSHGLPQSIVAKGLAEIFG